MDFAVIKLAGKQYLVNPDQSLMVEGKVVDEPGEITLSEVLLLSLDGNLIVGTPLVDGAVVQAEVVAINKGNKVRVAKFKAKSRYRRVMGFRPYVTTLKINILASENNKKEAPQKTQDKKRTKAPGKQ